MSRVVVILLFAGVAALCLWPGKPEGTLPTRLCPVGEQTCWLSVDYWIAQAPTDVRLHVQQRASFDLHIEQRDDEVTARVAEGSALEMSAAGKVSHVPLSSSALVTPGTQTATPEDVTHAIVRSVLELLVAGRVDGERRMLLGRAILRQDGEELLLTEYAALDRAGMVRCETPTATGRVRTGDGALVLALEEAASCPNGSAQARLVVRRGKQERAPQLTERASAVSQPPLDQAQLAAVITHQPATAPLARGQLTAMARGLANDAALVAALVDLAKGASVAHAARIIDALIACQTAQCQDALVTLLDDLTDGEQRRMLLQRAALVSAPTTRFIERIAIAMRDDRSVESQIARYSLAALARAAELGGSDVSRWVELVRAPCAESERAHCVAALGNLRDPRDEPLLLGEAASPDPRIRGAAAGALRHQSSPAAREALLALVTDRNWSVADRAASALGQLGLAEGDAEKLLASLDRVSTQVDAALLPLISRLGHQHATAFADRLATRHAGDAQFLRRLAALSL